MGKMKSKTFVGRENKLKLLEHYFEETIKNKKRHCYFAYMRK